MNFTAQRGTYNPGASTKIQPVTTVLSGFNQTRKKSFCVCQNTEKEAKTHIPIYRKEKIYIFTVIKTSVVPDEMLLLPRASFEYNNEEG